MSRNYKIYQRTTRQNKKDITCGSNKSILSEFHVGSSKKNSYNLITIKIDLLNESNTDLQFALNIYRNNKQVRKQIYYNISKRK
jgi:hypothetical protein